LLRLCAALCTLLAGGWLAVVLTPLPASLRQPPPELLTLTDRHGTPLREEGDASAAIGRPLATVPPLIAHAVMAAEDKRFASHFGVDLAATARAAADNIRHGRVRSGASTITQQLIKIASDADKPNRSWTTKFQESLAALHLEIEWPKERILRAYMDRVHMGNLTFGFGAAASFYFGKPLDQLSPAEAALLAGLPLNPSRLNPLRNLAAAKARQATVLRRMRDNGWLAADAYARAIVEPIRLRKTSRRFLAPHFAEMTLASLPRQPGSTVRTTLDLPLQNRVEAIAREQVLRLADQSATQAAVVVLENASGAIRALVGSVDFFERESGQVNGALMARSAGSTLKPFIALLALEKGFTPASVLADVPTDFPTRDGIYHPENFSRHFRGPVTLRTALACSLNVPAVRLLRDIGGPDPLYQRLRAWGVTSLNKPPDEYGLGLAIGNGEVRLLELANAFATLARRGSLIRTRTLEDETPRVEKPVTECDPRHYWLLSHMLQDNEARTPAFGVRSPLRFPYPVAAKTGTSSDFRDNWTVGFTDDYTVGVWVGNFDGSPMQRVSGVAGAGPIFHEVIRLLHDRTPPREEPPPDGLAAVTLDPISGLRVDTSDPYARIEWLPAERLPRTATAADRDASGRWLLADEYGPWWTTAETNIKNRTSITDSAPLRILQPANETTYVVDPDVPGTGTLRFLSNRATTSLEWHSDSLPVSGSDQVATATAREGRHRVIVRDPAKGDSAEVWISVKEL
jgi:penicillin-binding protein 1C